MVFLMGIKYLLVKEILNISLMGKVEQMKK